MKTNKLNTSIVQRHFRFKIRDFDLRKLALSIFVSLLFFGNSAFAQESSETVYKDWLFVGESANHVDVSARIVKCSEASANQVHLFIFNEGSQRSDIKFTINVLDVESGKSFDTEVKHTVVTAEMVKALCDKDEKMSGLKITLPKEYNPNNLTISINFN